MARPWRIEYEGALYHVFSRGNNHPNIKLILSQVYGENKHRQYCEKSQKYSDEHRRIREDIRHGFIYGSKNL
jgi:hypothetical protein